MALTTTKKCAGNVARQSGYRQFINGKQSNADSPSHAYCGQLYMYYDFLLYQGVQSIWNASEEQVAMTWITVNDLFNLSFCLYCSYNWQQLAWSAWDSWRLKKMCIQIQPSVLQHQLQSTLQLWGLATSSQPYMALSLYTWLLWLVGYIFGLQYLILWLTSWLHQMHTKGNPSQCSIFQQDYVIVF